MAWHRDYQLVCMHGKVTINEPSLDDRRQRRRTCVFVQPGCSTGTCVKHYVTAAVNVDRPAGSPCTPTIERTNRQFQQTERPTIILSDRIPLAVCFTIDSLIPRTVPLRTTVLLRLPDFRFSSFITSTEGKTLCFYPFLSGCLQ